MAHNNLKRETLARLEAFDARHDLDGALNRFLDAGGQFPINPAAIRGIKPWLVIERGSIPSVQKMVAALEAEPDLQLSGDNIREVLCAIQIAPKREKVELVVMNGGQIGLDRNATIEQIQQLGKGLGLEKCQPEDAVHAVLGRAHSSAGLLYRFRATFMMEPIPTRDGSMQALFFGTDPDTFLATVDGHLKSELGRSSYVFARRQAS